MNLFESGVVVVDPWVEDEEGTGIGIESAPRACVLESGRVVVSG